jgi:hypothetical protein
MVTGSAGALPETSAALAGPNSSMSWEKMAFSSKLPEERNQARARPSSSECQGSQGSGWMPRRPNSGGRSSVWVSTQWLTPAA